MYEAKVTFAAKSQDDGDFDMDAVVTYRNIKSVEAVDNIAKAVVEGLFALGKQG